MKQPRDPEVHEARRRRASATGARSGLQRAGAPRDGQEDDRGGRGAQEHERAGVDAVADRHADHEVGHAPHRPRARGTGRPPPRHRPILPGRLRRVADAGLHVYAYLCIECSDAGGGRRGVRVRRRRAAALRRRRTRGFDVGRRDRRAPRGRRRSRRHAPSLAAAYPRRRGSSSRPRRALERAASVVFLALPHGRSAPLVAALRAAGSLVVDLGADLRLARRRRRGERWYGDGAPRPRAPRHRRLRPRRAAPRRARGRDASSRCPGATRPPTVLALGPLVDAGLVGDGPCRRRRDERRVGGGRGAERGAALLRLADDVDRLRRSTATGTPPRWSTSSAATVLFTPHLVPMDRGLLATCPRPRQRACDTAAVIDALHDAYDARALRRRHRRPAAPEGRAGHQRRPRDRARRRTHRVAARAVRDRQPRARARRARRSSARTSRSGSTRPRGSPLAGVWP